MMGAHRSEANGGQLMMNIEINDEWEGTASAWSGCCCLSGFWGRRHPPHLISISGDDIDDHSSLLPGSRQELWVVKQLNKLKEVSELIAGPKWKTFLRKIGAYFNNPHNNNNRWKDFRYDSHDYALNFDDGGLVDGDDNGSIALGFSSRFAPPPHRS